MKQPIQLDIEEAIKLRDEGIKEAIDHAMAVEPSWGDIAYSFLMNLKPTGIWMMEDIRKAAEGIVPDPPDSRAWGAVVRKAARDGIIEKVGVQSKSSTVCHRGFASLWQFKS
jgi:hypothetical protein